MPSASHRIALAVCALTLLRCDSDAECTERLRVRAEALAVRGDLGEAIDVAARSVARAPRDARSWALLGSLQALAGHEAEAGTSFKACARHAVVAEVECRRALE